MSKQTYLAGFCKAAEAKGVDPKALARFALQKEALASGKGGIWSSVLDFLNYAQGMWANAGNGTRTLIGTGLGAALGTGLGAAVGGKKGLAPGAIIGALGGAAAPHIDWQAIINSFKSKKKPEHDPFADRGNADINDYDWAKADSVKPVEQSFNDRDNADLDDYKGAIGV